MQTAISEGRFSVCIVSKQAAASTTIGILHSLLYSSQAWKSIGTPYAQTGKKRPAYDSILGATSGGLSKHIRPGSRSSK